MRREEAGKPIEHEVQLQNDDRIKLIIKRKPISSFDTHKSSELKEASLSVSVIAAHDKRMQGLSVENDTTNNANHVNLHRENSKLSRHLKRKFDSCVDKEEDQPQKKFCNGLSDRVKPKAAVRKARSNADVLNFRPRRKYPVSKQRPEERFLNSGPLTSLSESSHSDTTPIRSLIYEGYDLFYRADNTGKCAVAGNRLQTADDKGITSSDSFSRKSNPAPVGRLKKVSEFNSWNSDAKVDSSRNQLSVKVLPTVLLPHSETIQSSALALRQLKAPVVSTPLLSQCQGQAAPSTNPTAQWQSTCGNRLEEVRTWNAVSSQGQGQTAVGHPSTSNDKGIQTEPHLLGPCDPGTRVRLESTILALDQKGSLVISVPWRGKTLSGFLMEVKPGSGWSTRHERMPEPQPLVGRLDRKCKRNVTYAVKQKRRRAAAKEQEALTEELDPCQEMERDDEQWQHRTSEEYATCPTPECFKKFVNETALRYHLTSSHQQKDDGLKPDFIKREAEESNCERLSLGDATRVLKLSEQGFGEEKNRRRTSQQIRISERIKPVSKSVSSSRKDCVEITKLTAVDEVPKLSTSLDDSSRFCAPMDAVPNVSRFKDALLPLFPFTKSRLEFTVGSVPEFPTSVGDESKSFSPADKPRPCAVSEPPLLFTERPSARSSNSVPRPTLSNILASSSPSDPPFLVISELEQNPITETLVSDQTSSTADAKFSSRYEQYAFTGVAPVSCDSRLLCSPARSASKRATLVADGDSRFRLDDAKFTSVSACAADNRSHLQSQLDTVFDASAAGVFTSLDGDLAALSFGDEYKSLGVGGSILGPEAIDLLNFDETADRFSANDCRILTDEVSRGESASSVSERLFISVESPSTSPTDDGMDSSAANFKFSSHYNGRMSSMCNERTDLAEKSQFLLYENSSATEFRPVDKIDIAENSHASSLHRSCRLFTDSVASSESAERSVLENNTILLDEKKFTADSQLLPPSTKFPVSASMTDFAKNSGILSLNEHLQMSPFFENLSDEVGLAESLPCPSGHQYMPCATNMFELPEYSQTSSVSDNLQNVNLLGNLQALPSPSSVNENLQVAWSCDKLQTSSSLSDALHASCSFDNFSAMFDKYLFASTTGVTTTEDEACTLSEKASVGGDLFTSSPICFGAEMPSSTVNEARPVNIDSFMTEDNPIVTRAVCNFNEAKESENVDMTGLRGSYSMLCYEPVSPPSPGVKSPTSQAFFVDPFSTRAGEFSSAEAIVSELPVCPVSIPSSSPNRGSEPQIGGNGPQTNELSNSKIVYDLSDISDPEDEAPTSMHFDPNHQPGSWFQLGKNGYGLSTFPSVLPSNTNYSGSPYSYSSNPSSVAGPYFESVVHGGNFSDALVSDISGTSEPNLTSSSTKMMLEDLRQSLQVGCGRNVGVQNLTSECISENLGVSLLPKLDVSCTVDQSSICDASATGEPIALEGTRDFQLDFDNYSSSLQQPEHWSDMFYANKRPSQRPFNQHYVKVLDSRDDYSGLQGYNNSASIVCDKKRSGSLHHSESTDIASLSNSVNSVSYTSNVSALDNYLEKLNGREELSAENYSCNMQRKTTSDQLALEVASSADAER